MIVTHGENGSVTNGGNWCAGWCAGETLPVAPHAEWADMAFESRNGEDVGDWVVMELAAGRPLDQSVLETQASCTLSYTFALTFKDG